MQTLINNKKIRKMNIFFLKKEKFTYFLLLFVLLFLFFSYAFQIFSSVSKIYTLEQKKDILAKLISENSDNELKYYVRKEGIENDFSNSLVLARNIEYMDSSFNKLVLVKH